jgi:putative molybdopterin biosynthesis protein
MKGDYSLTPEEVAEYLKIKKNTVYELIKRGDLAAYRVGRKFRIEMKDVEAYKTRSKSPAQATSSSINPFATQFPAATKVNEMKSFKQGLVICGQDILLDILSSRLEKNPDGERVYRKHVGSFPGLNALYEGNADIASAHLWDSDTDTYNIPYVRRLLPGIPTVIYHMAMRTEGFYVKKGNPLKIKQWEDLPHAGIRFINREPGSGARVLLDEKLRKLSINRLNIEGYDNIENSHTAIAIAIARGLADVGLGNQKTAMQVDGIEFIPMQQERYELVIKEEDLNRPVVQTLLNILSSDSFKEEIEGLGGYDVSECGRLVARV